MTGVPSVVAEALACVPLLPFVGALVAAPARAPRAKSRSAAACTECSLPAASPAATVPFLLFVILSEALVAQRSLHAACPLLAGRDLASKPVAISPRIALRIDVPHVSACAQSREGWGFFLQPSKRSHLAEALFASTVFTCSGLNPTPTILAGYRRRNGHRRSSFNGHGSVSGLLLLRTREIIRFCTKSCIPCVARVGNVRRR